MSSGKLSHQLFPGVGVEYEDEVLSTTICTSCNAVCHFFFDSPSLCGTIGVIVLCTVLCVHSHFHFLMDCSKHWLVGANLLCLVVEVVV